MGAVFALGVADAPANCESSVSVASANHGKELSEREARTLATKLANGELAKKGTGVRLHADSWSVTRDGNRWQLVKVSPAGPQGWVSFDLDGANPAVKVDHARE